VILVDKFIRFVLHHEVNFDSRSFDAAFRRGREPAGEAPAWQGEGQVWGERAQRHARRPSQLYSNPLRTAHETNKCPAGYGIVKVATPLPARTIETTRTPQIAGSKTVKIRYGPYSVPNASKKNIAGENGVLYNYPHINVERPCAGDCVLLGISAGLEYLDGKEADVSTGMWLHHVRS
jgi:hypothetical protein